MNEHKNSDWLKEQLKTGKSQREIAVLAGVHVGTIETYVAKFNLQGVKDEDRFKVMEEKFDLNNPEFCYLLGLFVTDGHFNPTSGITILLRDRDVLETLGKIFDCKVYLSKIDETTNKRSYMLNIPVRFCDYFRSLGYAPGEKTWTVDLPEIPECNYVYVMRGMIDGNGTIRKGMRDYECRFFAVSKPLVEKYKQMAEHLGHKTRYATHKEYGNCTISTSSLEFLLEVYKDRPELSLFRKRQTIQDKVDDIVRTYSIVKSKNW